MHRVFLCVFRCLLAVNGLNGFLDILSGLNGSFMKEYSKNGD